MRDKTNIFFFKQNVFRPEAMINYYELIKNQSLSADEINNINWIKRKKLLLYAYKYVPYYKKKLNESGIHPNDIMCPDDWTTIPILTKDDIISNTGSFISQNSRKRDLITSSTGGTTGHPLKVFHDRNYPAETLGWRMLTWWGLGPGADAAFAWRVTRRNIFKRFVNQAMWWPTRRIILDASSIDRVDLMRFVKNFNKVQPSLLQGYVGAINALALYIDEHNLDVHSPYAIWVTSSPISKTQRKIIESVFKAPVYNQYGCGEIFWLSAQCRIKNHLHMFYDSRHIEFINDQNLVCPPGEMGKIVITDLHNYAFPLIRYSNGDLGRAVNTNCPCGVKLPLMDSVNGRMADTFILPDKTMINGDYLTTIFDEYPSSIKAFQLVQNRDYSITLSVVPNTQFDNWQKIINQVQTLLCEKVKFLVPVIINVTSNIPDYLGKTRYIISHVERP